MTTVQHAIVLLSGGLDSTTILAIALDSNRHCHALSFDYHQRHRRELHAAKRIAKHYKIPHTIIKLPNQHLKSALTSADIEVPDYHGQTTIPPTYVPARNTIFLAHALGLAETIAATEIYLGASHIDYSHYPDCRPAFIEAFQHLANLATKAGIEGNPICIHAPLMNFSKAQTILTGISLNVDYSMTVSCYRVTPDGYACGRCDSCILRKKGFFEAGIPDPTPYTPVIT